MSDPNKEHATTTKVRDRIRQDAQTATSEALRGVEKTLAGRGFDPKEIRPLIREGAQDAVDAHR